MYYVFQKISNKNKIFNFVQYQQLKLDFSLLLDDKQELITERDGFRNKIRRLNYELSASLNANKNQQILDIDSILLENK